MGGELSDDTLGQTGGGLNCCRVYCNRVPGNLEFSQWSKMCTTITYPDSVEVMELLEIFNSFRTKRHLLSCIAANFYDRGVQVWFMEAGIRHQDIPLLHIRKFEYWAPECRGLNSRFHAQAPAGLDGCRWGVSNMDGSEGEATCWGLINTWQDQGIP